MPSKTIRHTGNGAGGEPASTLQRSKPDVPSGPSVPGRGWFDSYSLRAQWAPVLAVIAPPIFATYVTFPELVSFKGAAGGSLLVAALPPILAHTARNLGKRLEPGLWASWGGKPTSRLLRHRDRTIPEPTKRRYFATLSRAGIERPTEADEVANPPEADMVYASAGDWLRRHTRNPKVVSLVASKNAAYGFARNLLGVRWIGFALTIAVGLAQVWLTWQAHVEASPKLPGYAVGATVNLLAAALWVFAVRSDDVRSAADAYSVAILECLEPEDAALGDPSGAGSQPKRSTKAKKPTGVPANKPGISEPETGA